MRQGQKKKIMIYHIFRKVIKFPRYYTYKHILETVTEIPYNRNFFILTKKKNVLVFFLLSFTAINVFLFFLFSCCLIEFKSRKKDKSFGYGEYE